MSDKLLLNVAFAIQVQMEVYGSGLDVVMPQVVFNIRDGMAGIEHVHSAGMTETVNRINCLETFGGKGHGKIFFTYSIDPMPSQLSPSLVDEDPVFIRGGRVYAIFIDIAIKKLNRFGFKLYEPEPIPFSQYGKIFLLRIEVIEIQHCDFTGSCP